MLLWKPDSFISDVKLNNHLHQRFWFPAACNVCRLILFFSPFSSPKADPMGGKCSYCVSDTLRANTYWMQVQVWNFCIFSLFYSFTVSCLNGNFGLKLGWYNIFVLLLLYIHKVSQGQANWNSILTGFVLLPCPLLKYRCYSCFSKKIK